jgi:D-amino-acid dehydrogenase
MKIAVIGAGIAGITTAYELAQNGHQVTVFEKTGAAAEGASFANAGLIAPSGMLGLYTAPYQGNALSRFFKAYRQLSKNAWRSSLHLRWLWKWGQSGAHPNAPIQKRCLQELSAKSLQRLHAIAKEEKFEFEGCVGQLILLRSEQDSVAIRPFLQQLKDEGIEFKELPPDQARAVEPALHASVNLFGAIQLPQDEVVNCRQFAMLLKNAAQKAGVVFQFNASVTHIHLHPSPSLTIAGKESPSDFDQVVVCAGALAKDLVAPLKIELPIAAVYSYSLSVPVREPVNAPKSAVTDARTKIVISRLGNRLRVSGGSELGGNSNKNDMRLVNKLYSTLDRCFPGAPNYPGGTQLWKGASCATSDGLPLVGPTPVQGLWLNLGHGVQGWSVACGSAKALAELMDGREPEVEIGSLSPKRLWP